ncbi:MAG: hypothetical protein LBQ23_01350 [Puniceicoccales bacterium]|jgi:thymidine phosphorylase|nr:hypothetical protein [Puniceicoccales bacterium]
MIDSCGQKSIPHVAVVEGSMSIEIGHEIIKRFGVLIEKKVCGEELTDNEIREITNAIITEKIPDFQLSAFLMAVYFQSMSIQEASTWTEELMLSDEIVDTGIISYLKIDRCSTGGIGDKSAFALMAIASWCGIAVPKLVGSYDGLIISDLDKISSIPGFDYELDAKKFQKQLKK